MNTGMLSEINVKDEFWVIFQRSLFAKIFLNIILVLFNVALSLFISKSLLLVTIILSSAMSLFIVGVRYHINGNKLSRHFFMFDDFEININDIETIEFYSVRKAGHFQLNIVSPNENEYRLILKNDKDIKIPSYYMNRRMTIGEYICKNYKITKKETKKIKYIYGNY